MLAIGPMIRAALSNSLHRGASAIGFGLASFRPPTRHGYFSQVNRVKAGRQMLMTHLEGMQLIAAVRATAKLGGAMAEVGVFQGASARLIRESDMSRRLHLFDTFAGLPTTSASDTVFGSGRFEDGQFACAVEDVRRYLADLSGISFHVGLFPGSAAALTDERFSFVHLDVDLYESSRQSVAWFYDRLVPGAILLSHDFATCAGPRRALTEFFESRPEPLIEMGGDQALIVKL